MECLCNLPKVENQSYKATGHEVRLQNCLVGSGYSLNTKRHALECNCYGEELFHVSDEVTWVMRQHGHGGSLLVSSECKTNETISHQSNRRVVSPRCVCCNLVLTGGRTYLFSRAYFNFLLKGRKILVNLFERAQS